MQKLILVLLVCLILFSCSTEPGDEREYENYKIKVDKIEMPDTISSSDSLSIKFYGVIGTDGCHGFKQFEVYKQVNLIEITVWGSRPKFKTMCPAVMVYLDGREYKTKLDGKGKYEIIINQPDNSKLKKIIFVK